MWYVKCITYDDGIGIGTVKFYFIEKKKNEKY